MKNSKKCDFKKLALLGITGGTMLATQAVEAEINNYSELLASNACGGASGCRGSQGMGGHGGSYQAYRNIPSQDAYYYTNGQQYASCGGSSPQYYQASSCGGTTQPQYYQPSGYSQQPMSNYSQQPTSGYSQQPISGYTAQQNYYNQPTQGCGASTPQSYQANAQPTQGCGGSAIAGGQSTNQPNKTPGQPASNQANSYTQWETSGQTADNAKTTINKSTTTIQQDRVSTTKAMTEADLLSQLNEEGKKTYNSLDAAGKALALKMASQDSFKDKNLAVKAAALKMSEKRATPASSKY